MAAEKVAGQPRAILQSKGQMQRCYNEQKLI
jgi:hypothetical protein